jgi:hypothetical protein
MVDRHKMAKHVVLTITEDSFAWRRNDASIAREARLDGLYVIRTNVPASAMGAAAAVRAYKDLARVERAFRTLKGIDLQIRPVHHWLAPRVRAHVFLCMLAYYVEWHLHEAWAPLLFHEHDAAGAEAERTSPVQAAAVSPATQRKRTTRRTEAGLPVVGYAGADAAPRHPDPEHRGRAEGARGSLHHARQADTAAGRRPRTRRRHPCRVQ